MSKEYICEKCGCKSYNRDEIRTTGGGLSKLFDVQNKRFIAVSCSDCGYTELYRDNDSGTLSNIFDFLTS
ncbi:zinc ribbon domain-containing protein [Sporohalobacter salinus]|uniref:zinc ribbon domain-containing protein n=1 Tax=Sporohalobacter salinus TaxID=1494606 RepID=UPI0019606B37|nr:zinc ribbon domain-containing protein [Sporohalobacter salinus]MBM7624822.1 putative nucleic-acid-binding Zn-ribbon protein [Sporohalobacter salinus]